MPSDRDVFDEAAADYDQLGVEFFTPMGAAPAAAAGIAPGDHVLDVGCGRGAVLFPAAEAAGRSGRVTGIDRAPAMVALTSADADRLRDAVGEAGFIGTDIEELTVRSEFRDREHFLAWVGSHNGRELVRRVPAERRGDLLAEPATVLSEPPEPATTIRLITAHRPK
jgi:SAM-dependent methyltransferase